MTPDELKQWADGDPDRRREGWHDEVVDELNKHADRIEARLRKFYLKALIAIAIIGLTSAVALAGFGYLLRKQHDTTNAIQEQRKESIFRACDDQNKRHDNSFTEFNKAAADYIKKHPKEADQVRESVDANLAIIEALSPKQECDKVVHNSVKEAP